PLRAHAAPGRVRHVLLGLTPARIGGRATAGRLRGAPSSFLPLLLVLFRKEAQESLPRCSGGIGLAPGKAALILSACRAGDAGGPMADYLLNALVTLFVTVDPAGLGPIFLALTAGLSKAERHQVALRACATATAVLVAFALLGPELLAALGITLAAFPLAGG